MESTERGARPTCDVRTPLTSFEPDGGAGLALPWRMATPTLSTVPIARPRPVLQPHYRLVPPLGQRAHGVSVDDSVLALPWLDGVAFRAPLRPIQLTFHPLPGLDATGFPDFIDAPIPLVSARVRDTFDACGVLNVQYFPTAVTNPEVLGAAAPEYFAFNVIGKAPGLHERALTPLLELLAFRTARDELAIAASVCSKLASLPSLAAATQHLVSPSLAPSGAWFVVDGLGPAIRPRGRIDTPDWEPSMFCAGAPIGNAAPRLVEVSQVVGGMPDLLCFASVMSSRLEAALRASGVNGFEVIPAVVRTASPTQVWTSYRAFNVVGLVSEAEVLQAESLRGALVPRVRFARLAESPERLLVHRSLRASLIEHGLGALTFRRPPEWDRVWRASRAHRATMQ